MQQFLRYFFSLFCVGALFGAPQVRAASAEVAEGPSEQMMTAAQHLQFEVAARLRDEIEDLKKELRAMKRAH